jgi:hypothetical protein
MKRLVFMLFAWIFLAVNVFGQTERISGSFFYVSGREASSWTLQNGTLIISGEAMPDFSITGYPRSPWSYNYDPKVSSYITTVHISEGMANIGDNAFSGCLNLKTVNIPNTVKRIGDAAFFACKNLPIINIPNSVTEIGREAFWGCISLTSIEIPSLVTKINDGTFGYCNLTSIEIPNLVTYVGDRAFQNCSSLTSIVIPNSVTIMGQYVFKDCSSLTSVVLSPYASLLRGTFEKCSKLASVKFSDPDRSGRYYNYIWSAFGGCNSLTSIEIPNTFDYLTNAFGGCSGLVSIVIPSSVTRIIDHSFSNCLNLRDITVNWTSPPSIDYTVFSGVTVTDINLHVPSGTEAAYRKALIWRDFKPFVNDARLIASPASFDLAAVGSSLDIALESSTDWTASSSAAWLTISAASGATDGTITATAKANTTGDTRVATITFALKIVNVTHTVTVTQPSTLILTVSPESLNFSASSGTQNLPVASNVSWTATNSASWLTVSPTSGDGSAMLTVRADYNSSLSERTATITFTSRNNDVKRKVTVTQDGVSTSLSVSPGSFRFTSSAGSQNVKVSSNIDWTATSSDSWLTVFPDFGKNDLTSVITATANTGPSVRMATITFKGGGITRTIDVTQHSKTSEILTVSQETVNLPASGGYQNITVSSNTDWTVTGSDLWLTITPTSGTNSGIVNIKASGNPGNSERTTTVTFEAGSITRTVNVTQATTSTLTISPESLSFPVTGDSRNVTVTSNVSWTATSSDAWVTVSPVLWANNGIMTITVDANTNSSARTATVTLTDGNVIRTVHVTQEGTSSPPTTLIVSPATVNLPTGGGSQNLTITSNTGWSAISSESWLTLSPASGTNNGTIAISAGAVPNDYRRTATITITAGNVMREIAVTQSADVPSTNTLTVSAATLDFTASGETKPVAVTSNVSWIAGRDATWIAVTPESGSNNGSINVTAAANTTTSQRMGTVTVSGGGITQSVSITQAAYVPPVNTLTVSAATLDFIASGETKPVIVTSNVSWTTDKDAEWITVNPESGSNDGSISVTAAANTTTGQRTGTVTVSGGGITHIIAVTQAADAATLTVSTATLDFTASGETQSVTVTSNVNWTTGKDAEWITVTPELGSNDGTISVAAVANTTTSERTGTVTVSGGGITHIIAVTQAADAATLTVSTATLDFTAFGEPQSVTVTSNVSWTTGKDVEWITVTPESGSNDGAISVAAAANTTTSERTGTVTVSGGGITHIIAVMQAADEPSTNTLTVSPATLDFTAFGEPQSITVTSNVSWIAGRDAAWITVTPESGSNDGAISVAAEANTTTSERTGTVTITGGGITRTVAVTQAAFGTTPPPPTLTVSATDVEISEKGESQDITIQSNTSWTAVSSEAWASVSPESGTNDGTVSITTAANLTENARTATVTITAGDLTHTVTITQKSVSVDNAPVGVTDVRYFNSRLYVNTPVAERIAVYSLDGMMRYQSQKQPGIATFDLRSLPRGMMIVRGDSGWVKKIVR